MSAFRPDTRFLKSDGSYRGIKHLVPGDRLINVFGKPVRVASVRKLQNRGGGAKTVMYIANDMWHTPTAMCEHQEVLVWHARDLDPSWTQADSFGDGSETRMVLPLGVSLDATDRMTGDVKPDEELGFLMGAYLRIGFSSATGFVGFHCETTPIATTKTIVSSILRVFGVAPSAPLSTFVYTVEFEDSVMFDVFSSFKRDPTTFSTDAGFIRGVSTGINYCASLACGHPKFPPWLIEVLYWASFTNHAPLKPGQVVRTHKRRPVMTGRATLFKLDRVVTDWWSLAVDCPTHSAIAENAVVRTD
jgi:hypothetical protein